MQQRCYNPKHKSYHNYGGRGIFVCVRWMISFPDFLKDVGLKPTPQHSIDRINNDGNYEPGNVKWSTAKEQRANQRIKLKIKETKPKIIKEKKIRYSQREISVEYLTLSDLESEGELARYLLRARTRL